MSRRATTRRWFKNHAADPFVQQRDAAGYRSRAAFKLKEILARDRLITSGATVLELGASPGGWSQVVGERVGGTGRVVAVDLVEMDIIDGVTFIRGDCRDAEVQAAIRAAIGGRQADLVMSDMAPNISGIRAADVARSIELAETTLEFAREFLRPGGSMIVKLFQHAETDIFVVSLRAYFAQVTRRKPQASRSHSSEVYVVARGIRI